MIQISLETFLGFCAAVTTVSVAINWILKAVERLKKPNAEQNKRLSELEQNVKTDREKLDKVDKQLVNIKQTSILTMEAVLALLENVEAKDNVNIKKAKKDIQEYLINRQDIE